MTAPDRQVTTPDPGPRRRARPRWRIRRTMSSTRTSPSCGGRPALERNGGGRAAPIPATTAIRTNPAWKPDSPHGHEGSRHRSHASGAAHLTHGLDQTGGDAGGRLGHAGQHADLYRRGAQADRDPGQEERRQQIRHVVGVRRHPRQPQHSDASSVRPVTSSLRTPTLATSRPPVRPDATKAVTEVASHDTPVFVGE